MTTYQIGQVVVILPHRRASWHIEAVFTIDHIENADPKSPVGHHQLLVMTNGRRMSGWWFDPEAPERGN